MSFFAYKDMLRKSISGIQENVFFRFISATFESFIFSNIFISLSAVTLTLSSYLILLNFKPESFSIHLVCIIFFSTLFIYNFYILFFSVSKIVLTKREKWINKNEKFVRVLLLISLLGVSYNVFFLSVYQILFLIHLSSLALLYISPFKLGKIELSLRKFSLLKIFILAYVWTSVTVVLPAMEVGKIFYCETYIVFIERFMFIFALAIPFDIRDYSKDKFERVQTIPGLLGIDKAKNLSIVILLLYIIFSILMNGMEDVTISRIFSGILAVFLIKKIDEKVSDSYYMFWIDGVMVFHFLILSLVHVLI